jgi:arylamine N-acetyltransferase
MVRPSFLHPMNDRAFANSCPPFARRHIVNIVTLASGDKYVLDVGFGGDGPTKPLPLVHGRAVRNLGTQEVRLVREHIPLQTLRTEESKLWIYQYRNGADLDWNSFYAFAEFEFLHDDFEVVNWYTGCSPESFQKRIPMVVKFLRREVEGGEEEVYGKRMMVTGTVKENLGGKTKVVQECGTEDERIEALQRWFGITFTKEERDGIRGHFTELLMSP